MTTNSTVVDTTRSIFAEQRKGAERALAQLDTDQIFARTDAEGNSIAALMKHVGGNLRSRWSDFLTSDGEKADRNRDGEFEPDGDDIETIRTVWAQGWMILEGTLATLSDDDLERTVTIRAEPHTVIAALQRSLAHTAQHVGQIILLAKAARGSEWQTLSIPRGQSQAFTDRLREASQNPS
jgi:hypothetical protein